MIIAKTLSSLVDPQSLALDIVFTCPPHLYDDIEKCITQNSTELNEIRRLLDELTPLCLIRRIEERKHQYDITFAGLSKKQDELIEAFKNDSQLLKTETLSKLRELHEQLTSLRDDIEKDSNDIVKFEKERQGLWTTFVEMQNDPHCKLFSGVFEYQSKVFEMHFRLEGIRELFHDFIEGKSAFSDFDDLRKCLDFDLKRRKMQDIKAVCDRAFKASQIPEQKDNLTKLFSSALTACGTT